jgi:hypothetical protein
MAYSLAGIAFCKAVRVHVRAHELAPLKVMEVHARAHCLEPFKKVFRGCKGPPHSQPYFRVCDLAHCKGIGTRGRIQRKTWGMNPYAGVDYNLTFCRLQGRLPCMYHGQP